MSEFQFPSFSGEGMKAIQILWRKIKSVNLKPGSRTAPSTLVLVIIPNKSELKVPSHIGSVIIDIFLVIIILSPQAKLIASQIKITIKFRAIDPKDVI